MGHATCRYLYAKAEIPKVTTKRWDNKRLPPTMQVKDMEPKLLKKLEALLPMDLQL